MIKIIKYHVGCRPRFQLLARLGTSLALSGFVISSIAYADFPLVRHTATGEARARLDARPEHFADDHTTDDLDLSVDFRANDTIGFMPSTSIGVEGRSAVYPSLYDDNLGFIIRLDGGYGIGQGSPGGEISGTLDSLIEFTMPLAQIVVDAWLEQTIAEPIAGEMSFRIQNLSTGIVLYEDNGSYPEIHGLLEATRGDLIRVSANMVLTGSFAPEAAAATSHMEIFIDLKVIDCNGNGIFDPIDIANGTSTNCNHNGIPDDCEGDCNQNGFGDVCDIIEDHSADCNSNSMPDECDLSIGNETDCNANGIPDVCDVRSGLLPDQNANGFPDVCEFDTLYVDVTAAPGGNGSSWLMAYNDLQSALQHATNSAGLVHTIKVADGVYRPRRRLDLLESRSATFSLPPSVSLLGGFAGRGASDPNLGDPETFVSLLDGDIQNDDLPAFMNRFDNVYHVVSAVAIGDSATLDGFTIRRGQADGTRDVFGGGLYLLDSTPRVARCEFADNWAGRVVPPNPPNPSYTVGCGGAIAYRTEEYIEEPSVEVFIEESEFIGNQTMDSGGAVCGADVSFSFRDCAFRGNNSRNGGAFWSGYSYSDPAIAFERCIFENNIGGYGGAIYADSVILSLDACSLINNKADSGGGVYARATLNISDTTFDSNTAEDRGGGLDLEEGSVELTRCIFSNNQAVYGGGAIINHAARMLDCVFENNSATIRGGGLHTLTSSIVMDSSQFNNNHAGDKGGGVISRGRSEIRNCRFENNSGSQGGGLFHDGYDLVLAESHFERNYADLGGAVGIDSFIGNGPVAIERCELVNNHADQGGGLSAISFYGDLELRDCLIAQNYAEGYAGGLAGGGASLHISGCTIAYNTAATLAGGMIAVEDTTIENSILWGNRVDPYYGHDIIIDEMTQIEALHLAQVSYSTVQGWTGDFEGTAVSDADPLFVDPKYGMPYPPIGDFHLRASSLAINAGDPAFVPEPGVSDLDGHARILCGRIDMGAYESGIGDVNCDEQVDLGDFAAWPACAEGTTSPDQCIALDFDNDGDIDLADFAAMQRLTWNP